MEYDKEFEEYLGVFRQCYTEAEREIAHDAWQAARKDHYRIGEDVEVSFNYSPVFERAKIGAIAKTCNEYDPDRVRRIPAWKPKEGEAVLFPIFDSRGDSIACVGVYHNGMVYFGDGFSKAAVEKCKPFSADKIGKPWEKI